MGQTPIYGLRYPVGEDHVNIPMDVQELALDVESALGILNTAIEAAGGKPPTRTVILGPVLREIPGTKDEQPPLTKEEAVAALAAIVPYEGLTEAESRSGGYDTPDGCCALLVELMGGGGAGGMAQTGSQALWAAAGGGNGGWYAAKLILNPAATYAYLIGGGGPGIPAGNNGGNGAHGGHSWLALTESDPNIVAAMGGPGGTADRVDAGQHSVPAYVEPYGHNPGSIGDILIAGEYGANGIAYMTNLLNGGKGGKGGGPYGGNGGRMTMSGGWAHDGFAAEGYGGGGSGSVDGNYGGAARASQPGYPGILVITEFY